MESKLETPSVILKLMGLDKAPLQHPVIRDKQKVLSKNYLQKVASIGVRKKRSCHLNHVVGMDTDEKEESEEVSEVVKAIRRYIHQNPSKGNGKENPLLSGTKVKFLQKDVHGEAGLYETYRISESLMDLKDETFNSRIGVLKANPGKGANGLEYFSFPCSCKNSHLSDGLLKEIFYPKIMRVYPEMRDPKKISHHVNFGKESSRSVGWGGQGSTNHELTMNYGNGNRARNLSNQSHISDDNVKRNIGGKVGVNYSFSREIPKTRPLRAASVIADNCGTIAKDSLFQKYWGLRTNAPAKWSTQKSKNQGSKQKDCSEDMNPRSSSEKSSSFSSYFKSNHTEENCIDMPKSKKRCYENNIPDKKPMLPQLSRSSPSPTFAGSEVLQETCLVNNEVKNNKHEYSNVNVSKQVVVSSDSSIECLVSDTKAEFVGKSHNSPTKHQSTFFILSHGNTDSLSHTSYASTQQDTSEIQEGSVNSLFSGTDQDSLSSFEAYEPSPISVLDPSFGECISFSSKCCSVAYDSSEVDDEGSGLNVSSDEDCGNESVGDFEEKKDITGLFRTEESRDFSYVVEVLTEAGISNTSLFTNFSTWHSAECPISPSVFEMLEKKFGEQQFWKRSERRLLFDRINLGLLEILQPYLYIPMWEKPVSRRLNREAREDMIEEEIWGLIVVQEKKSRKEKEDDMLGGGIRWIELDEEIEDVVREVVKLLIEELADEIVSLDHF